VAHFTPLVDRRLVVVELDGTTLALDCDRVLPPEEYPPESIVAKEAVGGTDFGVYRRVLLSFVQGPGGFLPVLDPAALFSGRLLGEIRELLRALPKGQP
jgi:hypothetical protein